MTRKMLGALLGALLILSFAGVAKAGTAYTAGDVFLGVANVGVEEFTPTGTLVQTINGGGLSGFVTGMAFQNNGNLLVTDFSTGTIAQYDNSGTLMTGTFITTGGSPESLALSASGNIFVGNASSNQISQYSGTGTFINSATGLTVNRGTDWIDLSSDQKTLLYTSESTSIRTATAGTVGNGPDFATGLPGSAAYALRIVPDGSGDVLVADSSNALLLNSSGAVIHTYVLPGNGGGDFSLNLDPNGTDFWTADFNTGRVWEVNIATGQIDQNWLSGAGAGNVFGLTVFGQITASGGGGGTTNMPEPSSLSLLLVGLVGAGLKKLRG